MYSLKSVLSASLALVASFAGIEAMAQATKNIGANGWNAYEYPSSLKSKWGKIEVFTSYSQPGMTFSYSIGGSATFGVDYKVYQNNNGALGNEVTSQSGVLSLTSFSDKVLYVVASSDDGIDPGETVTFSVTPPSGWGNAGSASLQIVDDGNPVRIQGAVSESMYLDYLFTRTSGISSALTIPFTLKASLESTGATLSPSYFNVVPGNIYFAPGASTTLVRVAPVKKFSWSKFQMTPQANSSFAVSPSTLTGHLISD